MGDNSADSDWKGDIARSEERRRKFKRYLDKALIDPENKFDYDDSGGEVVDWEVQSVRPAPL